MRAEINVRYKDAEWPLDLTAGMTTEAILLFSLINHSLPGGPRGLEIFTLSDEAGNKLAPGNAIFAGVKPGDTLVITLTAPVDAEDPEEFVIWSHKRGAWWLGNRHGYTDDLGEAGVFQEQQARQLCEDGNQAWTYFNRDGNPPDVAIPFTRDPQRAEAEIRTATAAAIEARATAAANKAGD